MLRFLFRIHPADYMQLRSYDDKNEEACLLLAKEIDNLKQRISQLENEYE